MVASECVRWRSSSAIVTTIGQIHFFDDVDHVTIELEENEHIFAFLHI